MPSACCEQTAKKSAASEQARPQMIAYCRSKDFQATANRARTRQCRRFPTQLRVRKESADNCKAVRIRPAKAHSAMIPHKIPKLATIFHIRLGKWHSMESEEKPGRVQSTCALCRRRSLLHGRSPQYQRPRLTNTCRPPVVV